MDFYFKTNTANVTVDENSNGTLDLKFGTPSTAQIRFQAEGLEVGTGVAYDMKINIGNKKAPEYHTYIYVESLTDSTSFASYPERGAVDGVINDNLENRWVANGDGQ